MGNELRKEVIGEDYNELWPCKHQLVQTVPLLKLIFASWCQWLVKRRTLNFRSSVLFVMFQFWLKFSENFKIIVQIEFQSETK